MELNLFGRKRGNSGTAVLDEPAQPAWTRADMIAELAATKQHIETETARLREEGKAAELGAEGARQTYEVARAEVGRVRSAHETLRVIDGAKVERLESSLRESAPGFLLDALGEARVELEHTFNTVGNEDMMPRRILLEKAIRELDALSLQDIDLPSLDAEIERIAAEVTE